MIVVGVSGLKNQSNLMVWYGQVHPLELMTLAVLLGLLNSRVSGGVGLK